ncbi:LysR family transcriptional regulator [Undibacterium sp. CY18W]|uniref:LysR family transcriptional regulator n=2 Tax=Undibacterium hunanense TaxID=2762292 RepID=A0ABR6ZQC4_9BURK|nr:LysR family transcriptional regulator [Undibacterium hunanense]
MEIFVEVARQRSFSAAGRHLGISRAMVSKHIMQLEAELGARLLHRSTREVSLTELGQAYLEPCSASVEQARQARLVISQAGHELAGGIRIQAPSSFGSEWLADALARFALLHPKLQPTLHVDDNLLDPFKHGFDLSIRVGGIPDSRGLHMRRLAPCRGILCASPVYLAQHGMPVHPEQLLQHRCLHFSHLTQGNTWHFERAGEHLAIDITPGFSSNNGKVLHQAALRGLGIVYDTSFLAWRDLLEGRLIPVLTDWALPLNDFTALYPATHKVAPKVRALIDFLVEEYQPVPEWDKALLAARLI